MRTLCTEVPSRTQPFPLNPDCGMPLDEEPLLGRDRPSSFSKDLNRFSRVYLLVYFTVMISDWLQGPYLYRLYQSYGLGMLDIAYLFMTGFVSGAITGTTMGSLADMWGRRKMCLIFCLASSISLILRIVTTQFPVLFVSHLLSGLSAGLLYSVFETWLVAEYQNRGFPPTLLDRIFSIATFGNSVCAVFAGIIANWAVNAFGIHAPFTVAIAFLTTAALLMGILWNENYGLSTAKRYQPLKETIVEGLNVLFQDGRILSLGLAQTLFECSMYVFVLLYTPALEQALESEDEFVPLGYLFSTLMMAVMLGSQTFRVLLERIRISDNLVSNQHLRKGIILSLTLATSAGSFWTMAAWTNNVNALIPAFHIFEFSVGVYFPTMSSLKAELIPGESRAALMSLLRVPMNIGVCAILWQVDTFSMPILFTVCASMNAVGAIVVVMRLLRP
ncbi:hypothetical protein BGW37DRAFT_509126 [Umbelopsis sp. PMI_123]|nr:hypothetical protein BGW37DRAFT_509126 [Umbelopsis sp. PMI_123]